jgi:GNAT superfamily N-acetyltransferase
VRLIYEASFPPEQRVPFVALMNSVASGERTLWLSEGNHGFALTKGLETTGHEVLLEYLAVKPEWRSRGVGSLLLHDVYAGGSRPLVFEVEDPATVAGVDPVRRVAFYERNGAAPLPTQGYRGPSMTGPGTFAMLLFALPGDYGAELTGSRLDELITRIWVESYGRRPGDPDLATVLKGLRP